MSVDKTSISKVPVYESGDRAALRRGFYPPVKRLIDIAGTLAGGVVALPLVAVSAALVKLDGGPAFYHQKRLGKDGKVFEIWKLRSMVMDADEHLARYLADNPEAKAEWDRDQKLKHDPRITRVGRFLRKYSIDELPQLWNVFKGDMSLVGPRPMFPSQRQIYPGSACFALRPGITGLWQTSARNASSFSERADYDLRYAQEMSLSLDLAIMMRTVGIVLKGTGY
ncbi:sugar transferase [Youhaiella tibetensis]|uniref:Sugar transferase n=1 Tax=Paradevosia tibetensis TaxID=1447062 RepID=A0A5B9DJN9_9HYPH|nr:sugar transferase [Youhaiella tibetensis]QEE19052.1 sugar transferase [Youhaiella tibetensis]GGF36750.1 sugar transferase [Youhaiella tibetensis]